MDKEFNINSILLSVNMFLIEYGNWIKSIDYSNIENTKSEYLNTITMTNLKLNNISTVNELLSIKNNIESLLDTCLTDLQDKERVYKIAEYNKYIKPIGDMLKPIRLVDKNIYQEKLNELNAISKIFDSKLNIEVFKENFSNKLLELKSNMSKLQAELSLLKNKDFYIEFEKDKCKIIENAKKYKADIKNFDDYILECIPNNKILKMIISEAENNTYTPPKSNYNTLVKAEFTDLKLKFYNTINNDMPKIEKEVLRISTHINNFLSTTSVEFNNKWISIPTKTIKEISVEDQKFLEEELKTANAEIDHLSHKYGNFLSRIYDDYPKYLTEKVFDNIRAKKYM